MDKTISLFNELDKLKQLKDGIIDLTKPMDSSLSVYSQPGYSDPPFKISPWCSAGETGFAVSQVTMGTQTGTHIDAPAHFLEGGAIMNSLGTGELMGRFFFIDMENRCSAEPAIADYRGEPFLFIKSCRAKSILTRDFFECLLSLNARIWVVAGECCIAGEETFSFNRGLALAGKFLIEDLDIFMAEKVSGSGYIFAMPLKLMDTCGAPCRVVVINGGWNLL